MLQKKKSILVFYFETLTQILGHPREFFMKLPQEADWKRSVGFLFVSSLFFTGASLISNMPPNPLFLGSVFFINAMGMTFITAGTAYMIMIMSLGKRVTFTRFLSVYAFSSGVTLLASWLPFFVWLTEPWKWWLIGTGMTKSFDLRWGQAVLIIGVSLLSVMFFFWSLLPIISS
ncbi:YIP1 family protein [Desulfonema magnum]|uniref:Yip1 domain-containing protein n=1 Tax=Desulfonema magnum TaxID=45655 RepID=A0A975BPM5_9BACT|nr:YIP1 family protein [Desulfonema magnum]QTA89554.1 Yip1 domain-containing protein [Desulfonema magnum]